MTTTEGTVFDVDAWLDESWDPDLTVGQWWGRLSDARLAHPMLPAPWGRDWSRAETSQLVQAMVDRKALGPPSGLGMMLAAPTIIAVKMSSVDKSKCRGAWLENLSSGPGWKVSATQRMNVRTFRCVIMTPLGVPVEPEVYRIYAMSVSTLWFSGRDASGWF